MFFPEPKTKTYKELCVWKDGAKYKTFCGETKLMVSHGFLTIMEHI